MTAGTGLYKVCSGISVTGKEGFGVSAIYKKWTREVGVMPEIFVGGGPLTTTLVLKTGDDFVSSSGAGGLKGEADGLKGEAEISRGRLLYVLSVPTREKIAALGKRSSPETMLSLIREICANRDSTLGELALLLNRKSEKKLYERYVSRLVSEGKLMQTVSGKPTSPNQKYRAKLKDLELSGS